MLNNSTMKATVKMNQKRYVVIPVYCDTFSNLLRDILEFLASQEDQGKEEREVVVR